MQFYMWACLAAPKTRKTWENVMFTHNIMNLLCHKERANNY